MVDFAKPARLENIWASAGDKTPAPDDAKVATGFIIEIPIIEQFNYIDNKQDAMLAHINQKGIPQWDSVSSYLVNQSYVQGSNGIIYIAKTNNTNVNPVTDVTFVNWDIAFYRRFDLYTKTESDGRYCRRTSNLADLSSAVDGRTNLGVYSKSEADTKYLTYTGNLSGIASPLTAFNNIKQAATDGYSGTTSFASDAELAGGSVTNKAVAPSKLRLGFSTAIGVTDWSVGLPTWLGGWVFKGGTYYSNRNSGTYVTFNGNFPIEVKTVHVNFAENIGRGDISIASYSESQFGFFSNYHRDDNDETSPKRCAYLAVGR
jgi:hypothetical protein